MDRVEFRKALDAVTAPLRKHKRRRKWVPEEVIDRASLEAEAKERQLRGQRPEYYG